MNYKHYYKCRNCGKKYHDEFNLYTSEDLHDVFLTMVSDKVIYGSHRCTSGVLGIAEVVAIVKVG